MTGCGNDDEDDGIIVQYLEGSKYSNVTGCKEGGKSVNWGIFVGLQ